MGSTLQHPVVQWVRAGALWPSKLTTDVRGRGFDPKDFSRLVCDYRFSDCLSRDFTKYTGLLPPLFGKVPFTCTFKISKCIMIWNRMRPVILWNQQTMGSNCAQTIVPCIYRMPDGVVVSDSGLCCCGPAFNVWHQLFEGNDFPLLADSSKCIIHTIREWYSTVNVISDSDIKYSALLEQTSNYCPTVPWAYRITALPCHEHIE